MFLSQSGLIGAFLGLSIAMIDRLVLFPMIKRSRQKAIETAAPDQKRTLLRGQRILRVLSVVELIVFPIIGFAAGKVLSDEPIFW